MIDLLILFLFVILGVCTAIYLCRRALKGLRDQKMVADRGTFTGKDAVSLARVYFFFAAVCIISSAAFIFLLIARLIHVFR